MDDTRPGIRITWKPATIRLVVIDATTGEVIEGADFEREMLDHMDAEDRSAWFWLRAMWPVVRPRLFILIGLVLCILCFLTMFAVQVVAR